MRDNLAEKKSASYRIDTKTLSDFEMRIVELRMNYGEAITKEQAVEFLMEHALKLRPKEFLALYHAHKAEKFSKG